MSTLHIILSHDELERYAGYTNMPEFKQGYLDWLAGNYRAGDAYKDVPGQAWDRGAECAMRREREMHRRS